MKTLMKIAYAIVYPIAVLLDSIVAFGDTFFEGVKCLKDDLEDM